MHACKVIGGVQCAAPLRSESSGVSHVSALSFGTARVAPSVCVHRALESFKSFSDRMLCCSCS
jgi:hypothetical protein